MKYQILRGGQVKFETIDTPKQEFNNNNNEDTNSDLLNGQLEAINQLSVIVNKISKLNLDSHALLYFENTFEANKFLI